MPEYAGVDLGATKIRTVVARADRTVVGDDRRPTPAATNGRVVADAVLDSLRTACADAGVVPATLRGVGVGTVGPLDRERGRVVDSPNLPDAVDAVPLRGPLVALTDGASVRVLNDATAGVLGERSAAATPPENIVYLTVSSGIGAGVCVDGTVLRGRDGNAAEVGHTTVDSEGTMTCGCGAAGHWEAYCSGTNLPRYTRHVAQQTDLPTDLSLGDLTAADLFAASEDPLAEAVLDRVSRWNTLGVANLVAAYAPSTVAVGGAVALHNPDRVLGPVRASLSDHTVVEPPEIRLTTLGDRAVVRGALASVTPDQN